MSSQRHASNAKNLILLATTWFYFLVFAQFALLHQVEARCTPFELKWILGGMTLFGAGGALLAGAFYQSRYLRCWILGSQGLAALAAVLAATAAGSAGLWLPSFATGLALGVLTVAVVAWVEVHATRQEAVIMVGAGTGIAYLLANVPFIFAARPATQSIIAAVVCLLGGLAVVGRSVPPQVRRVRSLPGSGGRHRILLAVLVFGGLVWVDSGAFTWLQSVRSLHDAGWGDAPNLWSIGLVHCLAALGTGYGLARGGSLWTTCLAGLAALMAGYTLIVVAGLGLPGVWVYMTGVSIYSTALVAYPFITAEPGRAAFTAGWLFALSGWFASALGIGMVEDLGKMPDLCWVVVTAVVSLAVWVMRTEGKT